MTEGGREDEQPEDGRREDKPASPMSRGEYLRERDAVYTEKLEASRSLDTTLITLSSGAVALSVTFLDKIRPTSLFLSVVLVSAWILFLLSILLTSISHYASMRAKDDYLDALDKLYQGGTDDFVVGRWEKATRRCNRWSLFCFTLGIVMIGVFGVGSLLTGSPTTPDRDRGIAGEVGKTPITGADTARTGNRIASPEGRRAAAGR